MNMPMDNNDKNNKKKALDLMIVLGGPKGDKDKMGDEDDYSEKGGLEKMLKMHPLSEMSTEDLEELADEVSSELSSRGNGEEEESDESY